MFSLLSGLPPALSADGFPSLFEWFMGVPQKTFSVFLHFLPPNLAYFQENELFQHPQALHKLRITRRRPRFGPGSGAPDGCPDTGRAG